MKRMQILGSKVKKLGPSCGSRHVWPLSNNEILIETGRETKKLMITLVSKIRGDCLHDINVSQDIQNFLFAEFQPLTCSWLKSNYRLTCQNLNLEDYLTYVLGCLDVACCLSFSFTLIKNCLRKKAKVIRANENLRD